jgi:hypothetical protein
MLLKLYFQTPFFCSSLKFYWQYIYFQDIFGLTYFKVTSPKSNRCNTDKQPNIHRKNTDTKNHVPQ